MAVPPGARVSVFLGKGGVGKTAIAAAFALERAQAGERVLLTSFTSAADLAQRLGAEGGPVPEGKLELLTLDPRRLVDDIVRKLTKLGPMADLVTRQPGYDALVDIAPGVKEMAVFNLIWNERQRGFDRVVVDGPATGHGLHFLEAPDKTAEILVGRLRERALDIRDMLHDPAACEAVIVTLPEETPVRESLELAETLKRAGLPLDNVVINKWLPSVFETPESADVLARLEADAGTRAALGADAESWVRALALIRGQRREAVQHASRFRGTGAKLAVVPYDPEARGRLARVAEAMRRPFSLEEVRAA